jgi:hypothetical protein
LKHWHRWKPCFVKQKPKEWLCNHGLCHREGDTHRSEDPLRAKEASRLTLGIVLQTTEDRLQDNTKLIGDYGIRLRSEHKGEAK